MTHRIDTFQYRLAHPGYSVFPGAHPGQLAGSGQLFKRHEPLLAVPDPRRIDLRASLLDPFNRYRVRVFQQYSKLSVYVIADLSASMAYSDKQGKLKVFADFVLSTAQSALQMGDGFGFIGCGQNLEHRWLLPAGSSLVQVQKLTSQFETLPIYTNADSLLQLAPYLPSRRSLLFLVSDCHFSLARLRQILQPLTSHAVVPLVFWDEREYTSLPNWGLVKFKDRENKELRTLFIRPALKQRIIQAFEKRRKLLQHTFRSYGMEAMFLSGAYSPEMLTHYFQQHNL
ncbi:MxaS protein [Methylomonas sp. AM2-LC]|uniref:DUF58 domain-containing protein n=1 Tax=Methylomonas sp. AM2-LC TaxID=3153301 RepID=UPI0032660549